MRTVVLFVSLGVVALACQPPSITADNRAIAGRGGQAETPDAQASPDTAFPAPPWLSLPDASGAGDAPPACVGLQCQQQSCPGGGTTSLSGTAYAPNGKLPLYNVVVFVPNGPLAPFAQGVSCDRCGTLTSGKPIASALTDHEGKFKVSNVPVGKNIPVVLQVGKWRRKVTIPEVKACVDNPLTDPDLTRLPKNRSEGDMPRVAVTTGDCDQLGCLIPKLGVDPTELGVAGQDKAFTYFQGEDDTLGPPNMQDAATALWRKPDELKKYDMLLNSCLCMEKQDYKGAAAFDAVTKWVNSGGRMFGSHYSYDWLKFSPDTRWGAGVRARGGRPGRPVKLDTSFPKGKALADWMKFLDPALTYGEVAAPVVFDNLSGMNAQVWASSDTTPNPQPGPNPPPLTPVSRPRFITMNAPVGEPAEKQCGKLVHLDVHASAEGGPVLVRPPMPGPFPMACGTALTKAEHVLAFFIFDLAACIQEETKPPKPPVVN